MFATDAELGPAILGARAREWSGIAKLLEREGLPAFNPLLGGRYVPAIRKFFDIMEGVTGTSGLPKADGPEVDGWHIRRKPGRRTTPPV